MLPEFLIEETVVREDGDGPSIDLETAQGSLVILSLGITRIVEQESLDLSIWGSADNADWGAKPLVSFPQKFYCGTYQLVLDLSRSPQVKFLKARWKMNRWGRGDSRPLFGFYLFAQESKRHQTAAS